MHEVVAVVESNKSRDRRAGGRAGGRTDGRTDGHNMINFP